MVVLSLDADEYGRDASRIRRGWRAEAVLRDQGPHVARTGENMRVQNSISAVSRLTDATATSNTAAAKVIQQSFMRVSDNPANADQTAFLNRVVDAWCSRNGQGGLKPLLTLVGGYAGSGKSEFSRFLSGITGWAYLDKDSMTCAMAERLLTSLGGDPHDRHTELYLREVRPLEYRCLMETAFDNLHVGASAILSAPFIAELADADWVCRLTDRCAAMNVEVAVIWMRCDIESMRQHIEIRDSARDAWKLANWATYASGLDIDNIPPTADIAVDNRFGAAIGLLNQTRESLK